MSAPIRAPTTKSRGTRRLRGGVILHREVKIVTVAAIILEAVGSCQLKREHRRKSQTRLQKIAPEVELGYLARPKAEARKASVGPMLDIASFPVERYRA